MLVLMVVAMVQKMLLELLINLWDYRGNRARE